jgi:hypothetical protein
MLAMDYVLECRMSSSVEARSNQQTRNQENNQVPRSIFAEELVSARAERIIILYNNNNWWLIRDGLVLFAGVAVIGWMFVPVETDPIHSP